MPAARLFREIPDPPSLQVNVEGLLAESVAVPLFIPQEAGETPEIVMVKIGEDVIIKLATAVQPLAVVAVMV
jgi:hypothetical protein